MLHLIGLLNTGEMARKIQCSNDHSSKDHLKVKLPKKLKQDIRLPNACVQSFWRVFPGVSLHSSLLSARCHAQFSSHHLLAKSNRAEGWLFLLQYQRMLRILVTSFVSRSLYEYWCSVLLEQERPWLLKQLQVRLGTYFQSVPSTFGSKWQGWRKGIINLNRIANLFFSSPLMSS